MWKPTRTARGMYEFKHKKWINSLTCTKTGSVTTANITYHVGSRNEGLEDSSTHYLEHGMFIVRTLTRN